MAMGAQNLNEAGAESLYRAELNAEGLPEYCARTYQPLVDR